MSIPVICDRCRTAGLSGEADFSHLGDLLDFTPVPRKTKRFDGWNEERQRAFIAALAATGSKRKAARSIGRAVFGVPMTAPSPSPKRTARSGSRRASRMPRREMPSSPRPRACAACRPRPIRWTKAR
jgi:hypothetical protein